MADQQPTPSNKRPHSETPSPPLPPKARRLNDGTTTIPAPPISPPDSTKSSELDSSLGGPKQPESASNSSVTTAITKPASTAAAEHVSKPPVAARTLNYSEMSREELMKLHDPIRCAEVYRRNRELRKQIDDEISKMSRADWEQSCIDRGQEHLLRGSTPFSGNFVEESLESIYYSSGEE